VPRSFNQIGVVALGILILALGPIARTFAVQQTASIIRSPLPLIGGCKSLHGWSAEWMPTFVGADYSISDSYQCEGYRLHVHVVQYVEQDQGKEAIGEFNSVIPRSWWNATHRSHQVVMPGLEVDEYRVERSAEWLTIWNWYAVGTEPTESEFATKAKEAVNALRMRTRATSNITVAVEADSGIDATRTLKADAAGIWNWFEADMRASE
jgi:EpsI family protein